MTDRRPTSTEVERVDQAITSRRSVRAFLPTPVAREDIEAILDVPGIDGVFVGPFDLSGSMGKPGKIDDPEVQTAIGAVVSACQKRNIALCAYAHTPAHAHNYQRLGYRVIGLCTDYIMLARAAAAYLKEAKA